MYHGFNMKFAIIGKGFIYPRHKSSIEEIGGEIVDVVSLEDGESKWKEVLKNTTAKYISVLTPNDLHFEMCKTALDLGKKVLCEKPLGINSKQIEELEKYDNIFCVLQLRYHPLIEEIKKNLKDDNIIEMDISVYRDPEYYKIWKGQKERSGGVLFNLGIHYFDLLLNLFGDIKEIKDVKISDKTGEGVLIGDNFKCKFRVSTDSAKETQKRVFKINGVDYNFSSQDNLSYEDLHKFVYKDFINNKGVDVKEASKAIKLIEKIYANS